MNQYQRFNQTASGILFFVSNIFVLIICVIFIANASVPINADLVISDITINTRRTGWASDIEYYGSIILNVNNDTSCQCLIGISDSVSSSKTDCVNYMNSYYKINQVIKGAYHDNFNTIKCFMEQKQDKITIPLAVIITASTLYFLSLVCFLRVWCNGCNTREREYILPSDTLDSASTLTIN